MRITTVKIEAVQETHGNTGDTKIREYMYKNIYKKKIYIYIYISLFKQNTIKCKMSQEIVGMPV